MSKGRSQRVALLVIVGVGTALFACESERKPEVERPPRLVGAETDDLPAEDQIVAALHDLAEILEGGTDDPKAALAEVRTYVSAHRGALTGAAQDIEKHAQSLSDEGRTEYVEQHESDARAAMERFARAQQAFRAAASDADGIELTDVLNSLK